MSALKKKKKNKSTINNYILVYFYVTRHHLFCFDNMEKCLSFQDGRVCRISFAVQPDRLELTKPDGNDG